MVKYDKTKYKITEKIKSVSQAKKAIKEGKTVACFAQIQSRLYRGVILTPEDDIDAVKHAATGQTIGNLGGRSKAAFRIVEEVGTS